MQTSWYTPVYDRVIKKLGPGLGLLACRVARECSWAQNGRCERSARWLAGKLGVSVRTVERNLERLVHGGWLVRSGRGYVTTIQFADLVTDGGRLRPVDNLTWEVRQNDAQRGDNLTLGHRQNDADLRHSASGALKKRNTYTYSNKENKTWYTEEESKLIQR